jgi:hypothetical protein
MCACVRSHRCSWWCDNGGDYNWSTKLRHLRGHRALRKQAISSTRSRESERRAFANSRWKRKKKVIGIDIKRSERRRPLTDIYMYILCSFHVRRGPPWLILALVDRLCEEWEENCIWLESTWMSRDELMVLGSAERWAFDLDVYVFFLLGRGV